MTDSNASSDAILEEFRHLIDRSDAPGVRALCERSPAARALIDAPVFPFGGTAIGRARDVAMVDALLELGADPNRRSDWWAGAFHPLHSATGAVAERLMRGGAIADACAAANLDRIDLLRDILDDDPARVHERGGDGQTPLHFARSRAAIDLLHERGADIDARDVDHRSTPAQWMLDRRRGAGRYALAEYLVAQGATVDIFLAAALGMTERVRAMIEADPSLIEQRTGQGEYAEQPPSSYQIYTWTIGQNLYPIQVAEQFAQHATVEVLRSLATPKQRFLAACVAPRADEARRLLRERPVLVEALEPGDHRALTDAAWAPNPEAVALMMEMGFDPKAPGTDSGSALHNAAWQGSVESVRAILAHPRGRALVNVRDATWHGTPLGWCWHGSQHCGSPRADHRAVARLLIDAGTVPDVDWRDAPAWLVDPRPPDP